MCEHKPRMYRVRECVAISVCGVCTRACVCVCVCVQTCVQAWIPAQCSNCTCTMTGEHACTHEPRTPTLALAHTHKHARINARKAAPVCHGLCQLLHHQGSVYVLPSQQQPPPHRHVQRLHGRFEAFRLLPALPHADIPTERDRGYGRREGNKGRGKEEKDRAKGGRVHGGRTPEECRISTAMLIPVADVCVCVRARACMHIQRKRQCVPLATSGYEQGQGAALQLIAIVPLRQGLVLAPHVAAVESYVPALPTQPQGRRCQIDQPSQTPDQQQERQKKGGGDEGDEEWRGGQMDGSMEAAWHGEFEGRRRKSALRNKKKHRQPLHVRRRRRCIRHELGPGSTSPLACLHSHRVSDRGGSNGIESADAAAKSQTHAPTPTPTSKRTHARTHALMHAQPHCERAIQHEHEPAPAQAAAAAASLSVLPLLIVARRHRLAC